MRNPRTVRGAVLTASAITAATFAMVGGTCALGANLAHASSSASIRTVVAQGRPVALRDASRVPDAVRVLRPFRCAAFAPSRSAWSDVSAYGPQGQALGGQRIYADGSSSWEVPGFKPSDDAEVYRNVERMTCNYSPRPVILAAWRG